MARPVSFAHVEQAHLLYVQLTGQDIPLDQGRRRLWHGILSRGHGPGDVGHLVRYLQKEIRAGRRNVGALKLSNLLQPERFEEDLQISRVRLRSGRPAVPPAIEPVSKLSAEQRALGRQKALEYLRELQNLLQ